MTKFTRPSFHLRLIIMLMALLLTFTLTPIPSTQAATFVVNSAADTNDVNPGDGICADGDGNCTLRAAITEANALAGDDIITFASSLDGTTIFLTISGATNEDANARGDLDITSNLVINGNGVNNTIIDASALTTRERVFHIIGSVTVELNNLTVTGGQTPVGAFEDQDTWGGGILSYGFLTLDSVHVTENVAGARGGGVYFNAGSGTINNSTIFNNSSGTSGAGIFTSASLVVTNSTLSGNVSEDNGGGLFVFGNSTTLNHVTVTGNVADDDDFDGGNGGGISIFNNSVTLNIRNSIIAGNSVGASGSGPDCGSATFSGDITTLDYNLIGTTADCPITLESNDIEGAVTGLAPLADNGGPTLTHALLATSNAVDHVVASDSATNGCGTTFTTDQRSVLRPLDGNDEATADCDIGAYEAAILQCGIQATAPDTYIFYGNVAVAVADAGSNLDCLQVTHFGFSHPNATAGIQTGNYWHIEGWQSDWVTSATEDFDLSLTLPHSVTPDSDAKVCKYPGGLGGDGWDCARNSSTATTVTRDALSSLSDWAVGNQVGPTAVTVTAVTASYAPARLPVAILFLLAALFLLSGLGVRSRAR